MAGRAILCSASCKAAVPDHGGCGDGAEYEVELAGLPGFLGQAHGGGIQTVSAANRRRLPRRPRQHLWKIEIAKAQETAHASNAPFVRRTLPRPPRPLAVHGERGGAAGEQRDSLFQQKRLIRFWICKTGHGINCTRGKCTRRLARWRRRRRRWRQRWRRRWWSARAAVDAAQQLHAAAVLASVRGGDVEPALALVERAARRARRARSLSLLSVFDELLETCHDSQQWHSVLSAFRAASRTAPNWTRHELDPGRDRAYVFAGDALEAMGASSRHRAAQVDQTRRASNYWR